jgi:nucleoid DNA-binding protein
VVESLLTIIPAELAKGNVVELGDFGSFWLRINAEGAENEGMVRTDNITTVLPRFNPGKEFKNVLKTIVFNKN